MLASGSAPKAQALSAAGSQMTVMTVGALRKPPGAVAALEWTGLSDKDTSMSAALGIMRSGTVDAAIRAAATYVGGRPDYPAPLAEWFELLPPKTPNHVRLRP